MADARGGGDRADRPRLRQPLPVRAGTVARRDVSEAEAIENIDIGGPTMIRAAAKNHRYVAVVVSPESYDAVLAELAESDGEISGATRHWLANEAFASTARYDAAISRWFGSRYELFPSHVRHRLREVPRPLLRREPAPGRGALHRGRRARRTSSRGWRSCTARSSRSTTCSISMRRAGWSASSTSRRARSSSTTTPAASPLRMRSRTRTSEALACDPLSAFGGVIALQPRGLAAARGAAAQNFVEVLIAPGYGGGALEVLMQKESDPDPRGHRAARAGPDRARRQAGARRPAGPGLRST